MHWPEVVIHEVECHGCGVIRDGGLQKLAIPLRFEALCCAVEHDHPSRAATMREWSPAAKAGILGWLESITKEKSQSAAKEIELWRVTKDTRELRCVVRYMPHGLDLRLMQGDEFRRTELLKDAPSVEARAGEWRRSSIGIGSDAYIASNAMVLGRC